MAIGRFNYFYEVEGPEFRADGRERGGGMPSGTGYTALALTVTPVRLLQEILGLPDSEKFVWQNKDRDSRMDEHPDRYSLKEVPEDDARLRLRQIKAELDSQKTSLEAHMAVIKTQTKEVEGFLADR